MSTNLQLTATAKNVLVTGGSRGIGRAVALALLANGSRVSTCGRGPRPDELPPNVHWITVDVAKSEEAARLPEFTGQIDLLVNNAGVQVEKKLVESTDADWEMVVGTNCRGVFNTCRAYLPAMQASGGSIINIGSISGNFSDPSLALYNASKAFVHGLTRSIAVDYGPRVRCNAISPGWILTEMADDAFALAKDPAAAKADALARHPVGRLGRPEDIAETVLWLASDAASFVTGQCFTIDGGLTAASPVRPGLS